MIKKHSKKPYIKEIEDQFAKDVAMADRRKARAYANGGVIEDDAESPSMDPKGAADSIMSKRRLDRPVDDSDSADTDTDTQTGGSSPGGASTGGVGSGIGGAGTGGAATGGASTGGAGTVTVTISGNSGTGSNSGGKKGKGGREAPITLNISNVGGKTDAGNVASGDGPGSPGTGGSGKGSGGGGGGAAPSEPSGLDESKKGKKRI